MVTVVGVDVGGTFTDVVTFDGSSLRAWKTPTTRPQSRAVLDTIGRLYSGADIVFLHGTTVATNALLEESGAQVVLVTSPGFEDVVEIARQDRPSLYDLSRDRPPPLVAPENRVGLAALASLADELGQRDFESVAVVLIDSYLEPGDELAAAEMIAASFPGIPVSVSARVSPTFREYERVSTTVIDAYLAPLVAGYLSEIGESIEVRSASVMTSSGGLSPLESAKQAVGSLTLSGPAGGVVAADGLRAHHGLGSVIAFDMGGTSTDVSRIGPEGIRLLPGQEIGGRFNRVPSMPIHTVGAGGGSIAWLDPGGALRVGPASAGADPGPAAYGRGGTDPTVTDANLFLGYISAGASLAGDVSMDLSEATAALERLADRSGLSARETAEGIIRVADAHMDRAIRTVSIEEGFDVRSSSLVAFGGAGGLHASRLAHGLGMKSVLVPPHAGAFSALGLLLARPRSQTVRTVLGTGNGEDLDEIAQQLAGEVEDLFLSTHGTEPDDVSLFADARYECQSHELSIQYHPESLRADFASEHLARFGFEMDAPVEIVNLGGVATGSPPFQWDRIQSAGSGQPGDAYARIWLDGSEVMAGIHRRSAIAAGRSIDGPAIIVEETASILVGATDTATVLDDGTLEITW